MKDNKMKKKFIEEITEIMEGNNSKELENASLCLIKEAIRSMAKNGGRIINIPNNGGMRINVAGSNIIIGPETINRLIANLAIEGFTIENNGVFHVIQW
jgi:hypothetical protein